jgi:hypothetical protein
MSEGETAMLSFPEIKRILSSYGDLLEDGSKPVFMDESVLPASKSQVKQALWAAISTTNSEKYSKAFKSAYLLLSFFLPGVGLNGLNLSAENIQRWCELAERMDAEMKKLAKELECLPVRGRC